MQMFAVKSNDTTIELPVPNVAGGTASSTARFVVSNLGDSANRVTLATALDEPGAPVSLTVLEPQRILDPKATVSVDVQIKTNPDARPGSYRFRLRAYSADLAPEDTESLSETVEIVVPAPPEKPRKAFPWWIPVAAAVAVVAVVAGFLIFGGNDDAVAVPDVVNRAVADAVVDVDTAGLVAKPARDVADDIVTESVPPAGTKAKKGSVVVLLTKPSDLVPIPELSGETFAEATASLAQVGLVAAPAGTDPTSVVKSSAPPPTQKVAKGSTVELTVAAPDDTFPVPKLFSEQVPIAKAVLGSLGLLAKIDGPDDDNSCVFQQDPSDGRVRKGDTIILKTRQRAGRFCFSRPEFTIPIEFRDRIEILRPNH